MSKVKYVMNGRSVSSEEFLSGAQDDWLENRTVLPNTYRAHDPLISDGIGCLKAQVPEMRAVIKHHNIKGVVVRDSGQLEITSRQGRRELLKVRGLADADAGLSD
jgi:hypothetical protein